MPYTFRNWSRVWQVQPRQYHQAKDEATIVHLVQQAAAEGHRVRVVGAGHSWSPIALTDDTMLNLDHYNRLLHIDHDKLQVTVQGGMRLKTLNRLLEEQGLALSNLGSISEQSVAGVISTGTHGTGIGLGLLASQVVALRLIDGQGNIHELSAADGDRWRAALVGLGSLGIISTVTLQCVKAYHLEEKAYPLPFEAAIQQLPQLVQNNRHLKLWWFPHADKVQVYAYNKTDLPPTGHNTLARDLMRAL